MSENTKIEWTDSTFNPWEGCQKVGPGCDNCYAETRNARFAGGTSINWGPDAPRRRTSPANWKLPLKWNKHEFFQCEDCGTRGEGKQWEDFGPNGGKLDDGYACASCGSRSMEPVNRRVFCASLADVFDNAVDPQWRRDLFSLIELTPNLDWLLLTKRIGNVAGMVSRAKSHDWLAGQRNVWLGATIVDQEEADRDIPKLLAVLAAKRFLSMEPLLGLVTLDRRLIDPLEGCSQAGQRFIDWVIVGGESGPGARPMHPDWARSLRDQCQAAGVPFLFKQWGEHDLSYDRSRDDPDYQICNRMEKLPGRWINLAGGHGFNGERVHYAHRVGKKAAGRALDGITHDGFPS